MKIVKEISGRTDLFNRAIIEKYFDNGTTICTLQQVVTETDTDENVKLDEDGKVIEKVIKQDTNIGFEAGSFEFTQEDLDILLPKQEQSGILDLNI